ncbi:hypothetical protein SCITRI_001969 (plasmid) [Spiroplasma citri]|nr:hypothetical protein SCITRI_001969 [Spiroplasma citri]
MVNRIFLQSLNFWIDIVVLFYEKLRDLKLLMNIVLISKIKCIMRKEKRIIKRFKFTEEQLNFIHLRFNVYHDSPSELIYCYF